jgi:hypothetical protein
MIVVNLPLSNERINVFRIAGQYLFVKSCGLLDSLIYQQHGDIRLLNDWILLVSLIQLASRLKRFIGLAQSGVEIHQHSLGRRYIL